MWVMGTVPQLSIQGLKVLKALYLSLVPLAGADLMRATHISSGTMYPLLVRLEAAKIIESAWETASAQELHRPRMRLYRLTKQGGAFAMKALQEVAL